MTPKERLLRKTRRSGDCLIFTGGKGNGGYGVFSLNGTLVGAHRAAYSLLVGDIPPGVDVCHSCDNPPCVEPSHLYLGSRSRNMTDASKRGRLRHALFSDSQVRAIRESPEQGKVLARVLGVSEATISHIRTRRAYAHVD